jgi:hypothetical protein
MRRLLIVSAIFIVYVGLVAPVSAAEKLTMGHASIGASLPQGDSSEFLDDGWAIHGGFTWFSPSRPSFGLRVDMGADWWDVSNDALDLIDTDPTTPIVVEPPDDGNATVWTGSADLVWNPRTSGVVGVYVVAGVTVDYVTWNISEDGYGASYWCDWWWGYCYPVAVQGQFVIRSGDSWEWGWNAGIGVTFKTGTGEVYLEGIYHWVDTTNEATFIPVTLGYRW